MLNISRTEISGNDGKTNIFFTAKKPSAIQDFVIRYIAVNPHISFIFNDREYLKTIKMKENDLKKRSVIDIFSYIGRNSRILFLHMNRTPRE